LVWSADYCSVGSLHDPDNVAVMNDLSFSVTWDYRCPFARNAHEHLALSLDSGAPWQVTYIPFSLTQTHVPEGGTPVWDDPEKAGDLIALAAGVVVRDRFPAHFLDVHNSLFEARHDKGLDLREASVIRDVLTSHGLSADAVFHEIEEGWPTEAIRKEHEDVVNRLEVFGVPTFIVDERAAFVRFTTRPKGDAEVARRTMGNVIRLLTEHNELNEFKYTTIGR
jgi:DSBA-like thioredoxin domain